MHIFRSAGIVAGTMAFIGSTHALSLSSPAFDNGATIPNAFTYSMGGQCSGANQSPPLVFAQAPAGTRSLALMVVDPDGGNWLHWKAWNIAPTVTAFAANAAATANFSQAANDFGTAGYGGPCPPTPNHRYIFTLYALNTSFSAEPSASQLQAAALATATLTGLRSPADNLGWTPPRPPGLPVQLGGTATARVRRAAQRAHPARRALHLTVLQPDPKLPGHLQRRPACVLPERPHGPGGPGRHQHLGPTGCLPMNGRVKPLRFL